MVNYIKRLQDIKNGDQIFVIDQDVAWATNISDALHALHIERVKVITDPQYLLQLTAEFKPTLLFMGLLPERELSFKLIADVKSDFPDVPVIIATHIDDVEIAVECMRHGADDYLTVPINKDDLEHSLAKVLTDPSAHGSERNLDFREAVSHVEELPDLKEAPDILIEEALKRNNGVLKDAAAELGVSPQALCNRRRRNGD